jgi:tetratricopeptide (TPR) repeat protein
MRMRLIAQHAARTCALITLAAASPSAALLGVAGVAAGAVLLTPVAAQAQGSQAAARAAQAVTVRIEGATQGSGVLMERDGNRYTVLTSWHVVSAQRPGEELAIYTPDGRSHPLEAGSIRRLGTVDLAVLTFSSSTAYETARIGDRGSVQMGGAIYVSGFPLPSTAVPSHLLRFLDGQVIANAQVAIPNGYQLLYSNPTLPGMSGGPVLNSRGEVVGIHGQGETDAQMSEQRGVAVKTGTNQGVPIAYYTQAMAAASGSAPVALATARTADDYLTQAKSLLGVKDKGQDVIRLTTLALTKQQSWQGHFLRARAKANLGAYQEALEDLDIAILLNPISFDALYARASLLRDMGRRAAAYTDFEAAIQIDPQNYWIYTSRAFLKLDDGDRLGALADADKGVDLADGVDIRPLGVRSEVRLLTGDYRGALSDAELFIAGSSGQVPAKAFYVRALAKNKLGNTQSAIKDLDQSISVRQNFAEAWGARGAFKTQLGDRVGGCNDLAASLRLGSAGAQDYWDKFCQ